MTFDAADFLSFARACAGACAFAIAGIGCGSAPNPAPARSDVQAVQPAPGRVSLNHASKAQRRAASRQPRPRNPQRRPTTWLRTSKRDGAKRCPSSATRTETEVVEDVFLVVAPGGRGALAGSIDVTRRALAAYFNGRFSRRPERAISVYLFPEARSYGRYCTKRWGEGCSSPYGFYLHAERRIVMNVGLGVGTLTHELVHPLVESDFPEAPDWINEGIASLFEHFYLAASRARSAAARTGATHGWCADCARSGNARTRAYRRCSP